jgi:hypothetical protein
LTPRLVLLDSVHPCVHGVEHPGFGPRALYSRYWFFRRRLEGEAERKRAVQILDQGGVVPLESRTAYILGSYGQAGRSYRIPDWNGDLEVIRCLMGSKIPRADHWEQSVKGGIRRMFVPGDHVSIVRTPEGIAPIGRRFTEIMMEVRSTLHLEQKPPST